MPACPHCHVYKGLWSPLTRNNEGHFICRINVSHRFTRDHEGNFHSVQGS